MLFVFLRRQLTLEMLRNSVWDTIKTVGALYLIVVGAAVFNVLITVTQLPFTVVDFINDLLGSYFKVSNPNASSTCGCGTSFSV